MNENPNNEYYNLTDAIRYLKFAIQFTPQYGDSFLEMMRACSMAKLQQSQSGKTVLIEYGERMEDVL